MSKIEIKVPRLNSNDDELLVVDNQIKEGDMISKGQYLCTFETTKSSIEFVSEYSGKISRVNLKKDDYVKVGSIAFEIEFEYQESKGLHKKEVIKNIQKFTLKAEKIAKDNNVDLNEFKNLNDIIKVEDVIRFLNKKKIKNQNKKNIIVGSGAHACLIADLINNEQKLLHGFISENNEDIGKVVFNEKIVLTSDKTFFKKYKLSDFNFFMGIGGAESNKVRKNVFNFWTEKNANFPALISSKAIVSTESKVGDGTVILPGAIIGPNVVIGKNCIINNNSLVSHDAVIGNNVHLTPGSVIAGNCIIGNDTTIGMCATVFYGLKIGDNCLVYNNTPVLKNLDNNKIIDNKGVIFKNN
tara:strand:+ start:3793 stop:4857 length:1065 start_codon:yes stop_codon:yes gene_type:complete